MNLEGGTDGKCGMLLGEMWLQPVLGSNPSPIARSEGDPPTGLARTEGLPAMQDFSAKTGLSQASQDGWPAYVILGPSRCSVSSSGELIYLAGMGDGGEGPLKSCSAEPPPHHNKDNSRSTPPPPRSPP